MDNTFISIILPTYNRLQMLQQVVSSLRTQDYPHDSFEIIIINDGSPDDTAQWLAAQPAVLEGIAFKYINGQQGGPCRARNAGIAAARGELLAFIDDDCIAEPDWLRQLAMMMGDKQQVSVGGRIIPFECDSLISRYCTHINYNDTAVRANKSLPFLNAANMLLRTQILELTGKFDESLTLPMAEDYELSCRMRDHGITFLACPDAIVHHRNKDTFQSIHRAVYHQARGMAIIFRRRHPDQVFWYKVQYSLKLLLNFITFIPEVIVRSIVYLFRYPARDALAFAFLDRSTKLSVLAGRNAGMVEHLEHNQQTSTSQVTAVDTPDKGAQRG